MNWVVSNTKDLFEAWDHTLNLTMCVLHMVCLCFIYTHGGGMLAHFMCEDQRRVWVDLLSISVLFFWDGVSCWTWSWPFQLDRIASKLQRFFSLYLTQCWPYRHMYIFELRSLIWRTSVPTHWVVSPAPCFVLLSSVKFSCLCLCIVQVYSWL